MGNSNVVSVLILLLVISAVCKVDGLKSDYYAQSCPLAELLIKAIVRNAVLEDRRVGAGMVRLLFHDCFVEGCDASILIVSPNNDSEIDAIPNHTLHNLDLIDYAKAEVDKLCKQSVVSCADIVAIAASTSLHTLGGPDVDLEGGRYDGLVSSELAALENLPAPFSDLSTLETQFDNKGLSPEEMVLLSGAHTVGKAHCAAFSNRLYNFSSNSQVDPSLDANYAKYLQKECPFVNSSSATIVNMDVQTPEFFDNRYYQDVQRKLGLFTSDAQLYTSPITKKLVDELAAQDGVFEERFAIAFKKMSQIGVKTAENGNIRTNCRSFT